MDIKIKWLCTSIIRKKSVKEKNENAIEKTWEWNDYAPAAACLGPPKPPRGLPAEPRQEKETPKEPGFQIQEKKSEKRKIKQNTGVPLRTEGSFQMQLQFRNCSMQALFFILIPFFFIDHLCYVFCNECSMDRKWLRVDQWSHQSQFAHFRNQLRCWKSPASPAGLIIMSGTNYF